MSRLLKTGVLGGVVGGIIFGIMMQMMGMIPMIAMMVGSKSTVVGWGIHMIISIIFGAVFGYLVTFTKHMFILSVIYGIIIWIVGPLVIMPLMLGMGTMIAHAFEPQQLMSLMTHLFFSFVLAATVKIAERKTAETDVNVTN
ncbi:hypothetical protein NP92_08560 [Anoxybacillus gonensis]|uniref:DUF1440 domain-containing protein n=2 Tax=Anoxybacillaceae TaxID=3120669 RepID=A0A0D8BPQ9_GEOKU|nr:MULTISPECIES: hypothetical protein [Bacillaceae]AKS38365.1 hypothetical protein AFK25_07310 [Anoxybacillus gonensis]KGP60465.1 hypothetical protein NP92_08560 [Anoxybacillus gonensis]KJE25989.1 hypothetical protein LG52_2463 [Geobacillus kaustophilus]MCX8046324.1 DUF1440 domain-containing protein [Anoxybacillus gonensis]MDO0877733.1 DUF1440 domain-containing protein [Anoxybacillus gonensis]